jgi:hypothetical protein
VIGQFQIFQSLIVKLASHSARRRAAMKTSVKDKAAAESSRILRVVASVPPGAFRRRREFASRFSSPIPLAARKKEPRLLFANLPAILLVYVIHQQKCFKEYKNNQDECHGTAK